MAEYFINADTGDDGSGDGSSGNPWETLAYAYDNSGSGDTITCQVSTANYAFVTDTIEDRTVRGASIINPAVFDGSAGTVQWTVTTDTTFQDIVFQNASTDTDDGLFADTLTSGETLTFTRVRFSSITANNNVNRGAIVNGESILGEDRNYVFTSCVFDDIMKNGSGVVLMKFRGSSGFPVDLTLNHCVFYFANSSPTWTYLFEAHSSASEFNITLNNTIIENQTGGGLTWKDPALSAGRTEPTNILSHVNTRNITDVPAGTDMTTVDPLFLGPSTGNFNLDPTSTLIGGGVSI